MTGKGVLTVNLCNISQKVRPEGDISSALVFCSTLKSRPHMQRKVLTLRQWAQSGKVICSAGTHMNWCQATGTPHTLWNRLSDQREQQQAHHTPSGTGCQIKQNSNRHTTHPLELLSDQTEQIQENVLTNTTKNRQTIIYHCFQQFVFFR